MSQQTFCDGCGKQLSWESGAIHPERVAISGERVNQKLGGALPDGRFDWCYDCGVIAFAAVKAARNESARS